MKCLLTRNCYKTDDYIKLTKSEIKQILMDYNVQNKISNKSILIKKMIELNACISIQTHFIKERQKFIKINDICPITQEKPGTPIRIYSKDNRKPFTYFVCTYELSELAKYLIMTSRFEDIITKTKLSIIQIKDIDFKICENFLFLPSLYYIYKTKEKLELEYERTKLLMGLERSMSKDVDQLYDYVYEDNIVLTINEIKILLKEIARTLVQIKKIDTNYFNYVKSDLVEHFKEIKTLNMEKKTNVIDQIKLL